MKPNVDLRKEERWVPVAESGERWVGRSKAEAEAVAKDYYPGGTFSDGHPWDGITHIIKEERWVSEWVEVES